MTLLARFERIPASTPLPRSSHSLSIIKGKAYIFGGEIRPRKPVDNDMHVFSLPSSSVTEIDYERIPAKASSDTGDVPASRVGHVAATVQDRIYIFGGRGGADMQPLEENGRLWVFDTKSGQWSYVDPIPGSPHPLARSYHASTATDYPRARVRDLAAPLAQDTLGTIFIHGGCSASGRLADVWAFNVPSRTWFQYPDAPGPDRGGACLTYVYNCLYRFGGFDGKSELGGQLDRLQLSTSTSEDKTGTRKTAMTPLNGVWDVVKPPQGTAAPGNRSVAGLQPVTTGQGRNYLLLFLGEKDPSSAGHAGAGKFWDDVWAFDVHSDRMTAASVYDATKKLIGADTHEDLWSKIKIPESSMTADPITHPGERGWFASAQSNDPGFASVVIWGGINGRNERLGDGWTLKIDA